MPSTHCQIYASYERRIAAVALDFLCLVPLPLAANAFGRTPFDYVATLYPAAVFASLFMNLFMVTWFGGSPGKLLLGIRIARVDGSNARLREAALRIAIHTCIGFLITYGMWRGYVQISQEHWDAYRAGLGGGAGGRNREMFELAPTWVRPANWVFMAWGFCDCAVWLLDRHKKRRALHDYIAGTVVIRKGWAWK